MRRAFLDREGLLYHKIYQCLAFADKEGPTKNNIGIGWSYGKDYNNKRK